MDSASRLLSLLSVFVAAVWCENFDYFYSPAYGRGFDFNLNFNPGFTISTGTSFPGSSKKALYITGRHKLDDKQPQIFKVFKLDTIFNPTTERDELILMAYKEFIICDGTETSICSPMGFLIKDNSIAIASTVDQGLLIEKRNLFEGERRACEQVEAPPSSVTNCPGDSSRHSLAGWRRAFSKTMSSTPGIK